MSIFVNVYTTVQRGTSPLDWAELYAEEQDDDATEQTQGTTALMFTDEQLEDMSKKGRAAFMAAELAKEQAVKKKTRARKGFYDVDDEDDVLSDNDHWAITSSGEYGNNQDSTTDPALTVEFAETATENRAPSRKSPRPETRASRISRTSKVSKHEEHEAAAEVPTMTRDEAMQWIENGNINDVTSQRLRIKRYMLSYDSDAVAKHKDYFEMSEFQGKRPVKLFEQSEQRFPLKPVCNATAMT